MVSHSYLSVRSRFRYPFLTPAPRGTNLGSRYRVRRQLHPLGLSPKARNMPVAQKQAHIVVIDIPLLDTRNANDLTGTFIADIVLQLLSYVAQTERENIRQRQTEGIAAAKARGIQFGRPKKERTQLFYDLKDKYSRKEISARHAAKILGISHSTFLKWIT